ncbi:MAG: hypothetical protein FH758_12550 [Firmicutes bacterium]|nr:hypothetical protein [Bacillota bacterium]
MTGKQRISPNQATAFVIAGGVGIIFFWITEASIPIAGRDAWLSYAIGYSIGILIAFSLIALNKRFPGKTLVQYVPLILGQPLGYFYNILFILTYTYFTALILNLSINMISLFYEETPGLILTGVSVVLISYVCKHGIEVFGRVCELFIPLILFGIFFITINVIPHMDINRLAPVLEKGVMPVLELVPHTVSFVGEYIVFMALWLPLLNKPNKAKKVVIVGTSISALALITILITGIVVFGEDFAKNLAFSTVKMTLLSVLPGVEGLPSLTLGIWIIAAFVKGAVFFFLSVISLAHSFNLKDYRSLVWPMALVVTALSLLPDNYFASLTENKTLGLYFSLPITLSIPVLLGISIARKT